MQLNTNNKHKIQVQDKNLDESKDDSCHHKRDRTRKRKLQSIIRSTPDLLEKRKNPRESTPLQG